MVVEALDALRLMVVIVLMVHHMTIPQGIVSHDETAGIELLHRHLVGFYIGAFVAVDEHHVELQTLPIAMRISNMNKKYGESRFGVHQ